jgi:hypothetical protein
MSAELVVEMKFFKLSEFVLQHVINALVLTVATSVSSSVTGGTVFERPGLSFAVRLPLLESS